MIHFGLVSTQVQPSFMRRMGGLNELLRDWKVFPNDYVVVMYLRHFFLHFC